MQPPLIKKIKRPDLPLKISRQLFPSLDSPLLQDEAMRLSHWCSGRVNEAVHRMRLNLTIHLDVTICLSLHEPRLFHFGGVRQHSREHAMNIIMDLTKLRRRRTENVKKTIGLMSKTTTLHVHHAFLYISLLSLHNNDVT